VGLTGLALVVLCIAFLDDQFQIAYVAQHSNLALPEYYKIAALWAGQEGSLLLWSFMQALFTALAIARPSEKARQLVPWATVIMNLVTAFFIAVTLFPSNPFRIQDPVPFDGMGMNPLLRHPGMVFHPPALYLGYVGLAVPFAFAIAALIVRRVDDWPVVARRWTVAAWLFLGLGLLLGARWAYDVLGWGGYWAWDPVENAGLLPWFTATALLHSSVMQDQYKSFRWWNLLMAVFSFVLVLFGTFTTRSGVIQSVHAFPESGMGPYFLWAIIITLGTSLALALWRNKDLVSSQPVEGILSREGLFLITLMIFTTLTISVFVGSVLPTITEILSGQRYEAGPEWFDRVTGPQFALLVFVLGLCPILGRSAGVISRLKKRGWPILIGMVLLPLAGWLMGLRDWASVLGFALLGLAGSTALAEFVRDAAARNRSTGEGFLLALGRLFGRNRRRYGGYLVHMGIILMALGIIGTRLHAIETEEVFTYGGQAQVGEYTLVYEDIERELADENMRTMATFSVYRDGAYLITLKPWVDDYYYFDQTVATPALWTGLREDLYLVLAGWSGDGASATLKIYVNPLASFLWLGGLVFLAGGTVAVWPTLREEQLTPLQFQRRRVLTTVGALVGVLALVAAGWAMWGPNPSAEVLPAARPLVGQEPPDFSLDLLDGSTVSLSDLDGQVVLVNFWATWCPPCQEELPALQEVWQEYESDGVAFVGVAYQDEEPAVRRMAGDFGLTFDIGLDQEERIGTSFGVTGVPETFVIDASGAVSQIYIGPVTAAELRAELDSLLGR
jgi:cytochrome c-type biogenesis protein CcmF